MKITKRDAKYFIYGVLFMLLVELVFGFDDFIEGFKQGQEASKRDSNQEQVDK